MIVSPVQNIYARQNFKANNRWITDRLGIPIYKTTTYCFRDDIDWENLIKFLCMKYRDVPIVNVVAHACSNGMEPLSFLMALLVHAPQDLKKFTPIIAKDLNADNIYMAKKNIFPISAEDFFRIQENTKCKYLNFIELEKYKNDVNQALLMKPKKILTDNIIFEQGNIFDDVPKLSPENTILFCRNMWMYLNKQEKTKLAELLGKRLEKSSTVILGYLDVYNAEADKFLLREGFHRCNNMYGTQNYLFSK